jgi:hypothetical protein
MTLKIGDRVRLRPWDRSEPKQSAPVGSVLKFPRKHDGEPPLAIVRWDHGSKSPHDRRNLVRAKDES